MTDADTVTANAARQAFDAWCDGAAIPSYRRRRRQQWIAFLAGWIASQAPRQAATRPRRRCETAYCGTDGSCEACGAQRGEACRAPRAELARPLQSRKNSRTDLRINLNPLNVKQDPF